MRKISTIKLILILSSVIMLTLLLTSCGSDTPAQRLPDRHVFNPGAVFATNINHDDPRSVLRCAIMFEVLDERAGEELLNFADTIRNAVLTVMGELTMAEVTTEKNLDDIASRIVERVNAAIGGPYTLIIGASFTEFVLT